MKFLLKFSFPVEHGNQVLQDPEFGHKLQELLQDIKAEATYLTTLNGQRGGYIVVNMDDASQLPQVAEPLFLWLKADVEAIPVFTPQDMPKAMPAIEAAIKKWG